MLVHGGKELCEVKYMLGCAVINCDRELSPKVYREVEIEPETGLRSVQVYGNGLVAIKKYFIKYFCKSPSKFFLHLRRHPSNPFYDTLHFLLKSGSFVGILN